MKAILLLTNSLSSGWLNSAAVMKLLLLSSLSSLCWDLRKFWLTAWFWFIDIWGFGICCWNWFGCVGNLFPPFWWIPPPPNVPWWGRWWLEGEIIVCWFWITFVTGRLDIGNSLNRGLTLWPCVWECIKPCWCEWKLLKVGSAVFCWEFKAFVEDGLKHIEIISEIFINLSLSKRFIYYLVKLFKR